jgi:DNA-binding transcriptional regulator YiaG
VLLEAASLRRPVEVARVLKRHGLTLRKAHGALNKLAEGRTAIAAIPAEAYAQLGADLLALGVTARRVTRPEVDPKQVREASGLSQADFARLFGLELDTLQNWEQGRNKPDNLAQIYLSIVQNFPEIPKAILTGREREILITNKR